VSNELKVAVHVPELAMRPDVGRESVGKRSAHALATTASKRAAVIRVLRIRQILVREAGKKPELKCH
jgi:hypothetical protein